MEAEEAKNVKSGRAGINFVLLPKTTAGKRRYAASFISSAEKSFEDANYPKKQVCVFFTPNTVGEKLFGGTEFQNKFKKRRKHLLNLGSLEKDCV